MTSPTVDQLAEKLNELIVRHNELAHAVDNLCQAVDTISATLLTQEEPPKILDS